MADPNIGMLRVAVTQLADLADELVFVGGATTGLFITDAASADVRSTRDVDAIVEATTYSKYVDFERRLEKAGFLRDISDGAPICRWTKGETIFDILPIEGNILGFRNSWYSGAVATAVSVEIAPKVHIRVITPIYFLATKLEAFTDRGENDFLGSSDLEDIISVVNGREELIFEVEDAPDDVRAYIAAAIADLLSKRAFIDALPGHLNPDDSRINIVVNRLQQLARL
jgi:hypothetical protein